MDTEDKNDIIKVIEARFGDLHEPPFEELINKSVDELKEIAYRDSTDLHR